MHFLQAIISDCQTRLLNVFGQIAMFWEIKTNYQTLISSFQTELKQHSDTAYGLMIINAKVSSFCCISWDCFVAYMPENRTLGGGLVVGRVEAPLCRI